MKRAWNKKENTVDRAYKGVLYPDREHQALIGKTIRCCSFVYNRFRTSIFLETRSRS